MHTTLALNKQQNADAAVRNLMDIARSRSPPAPAPAPAPSPNPVALGAAPGPAPVAAPLPPPVHAPASAPAPAPAPGRVLVWVQAGEDPNACTQISIGPGANVDDLRQRAATYFRERLLRLHRDPADLEVRACISGPALAIDTPLASVNAGRQHSAPFFLFVRAGGGDDSRGSSILASDPDRHAAPPLPPCVRMGCSNQTCKPQDRQYEENKDARDTYNCLGKRTKRSSTGEQVECGARLHLCCGRFWVNDNGHQYKKHRTEAHSPALQGSVGVTYSTSTAPILAYPVPVQHATPGLGQAWTTLVAPSRSTCPDVPPVVERAMPTLPRSSLPRPSPDALALPQPEPLPIDQPFPPHLFQVDWRPDSPIPTNICVDPWPVDSEDLWSPAPAL